MRVLAARTLRAACVLCAASLAACAAEPPPPGPAAARADTWIANARLWGSPGVWTLRLADGRVADVARAGSAPLPAAAAGRAIDAAGGLVLPGFHDAHVHAASGGAALGRLALADETSVEAIARAVRRFAARHPDAPWILGRGWQYDVLPEGRLPHRDVLDAAVPGRPVLLESYDGHALWANSRALEAAGVGPDTPDPPDGAIVREPGSRTPTGVLLDGAGALVEDAVPAPDRDAKLRTLERALRHLVALGVTAIDDFPRDADAVDLYAELDAAGRLPLRVRVSLPLDSDLERFAALRERLGPAAAGSPLGERRPRRERLEMGYLKGFVDGVIESKTAWLLDPYAGGDTRGRPLIPRQELVERVTAAQEKGLPVALHAIGDAAVRLSLDAFAAARRAHPRPDLHHRIEHIELVHPDDLPRFADLGVVASMQPFHANPFGPDPDAGVWSRNLGPERPRRSFAWRDLRDADAPLVFGSDWPVLSADPLKGLAVATTRRDARGLPEAGWNAHQTLTADEALAAYAGTASAGGPPRGVAGRVLQGMRADLVLLAPGVDPSIPETLWRGPRVRAVWVGGALERAAEEPPPRRGAGDTP